VILCPSSFASPEPISAALAGPELPAVRRIATSVMVLMSAPVCRSTSLPE
jgi:hypothetical protein